MSLIIGKSVSKVAFSVFEAILIHIEFSNKLFRAMVTLHKQFKRERDVAHNFKTSAQKWHFFCLSRQLLKMLLLLVQAIGSLDVRVQKP